METHYLDALGRRYPGRIAESAPVQSTEWARPEKAWAEQDKKGRWILKWSGHGGYAHTGAGQDALLASFMKLEEAAPEEVAAFIGRWGPLNLCKHGLPNTHLPRRMMNDLAEVDAVACEVNRARPAGEIGEPLERWHHFATQVHAIHRGARLAQGGNRITNEIWTKLADIGPPGMFTEPDPETGEVEWVTTPAIDVAQRYLGIAIQRWLNYGDVGVHVSWSERKGHIRFGGTGLAGAIALQLALTSTATGAFYLCSACSVPFLPEKRTPRAGERHYCDSCREGDRIPARDRARDYRARKKNESK